MKTEESIEEIRAKAWTFRGITPPNGAVKVAEEKRRGELFEYYRDLDGKVWYETTTGREWKLKIAKWEKERQKKEALTAGNYKVLRRGSARVLI